MSLSTTTTASITLLHASIFLLAAAISFTYIPVAAVEHGEDVKNTTTTTMFTNSSASPADNNNNKEEEENWEMYFCFLCSGRDPLLIHHCPIYWDYCHLICDDDMTTSTAPVSPAAGHEECYVMKLYMSGRYVIVQRLPCVYIAYCFLTCGGGELADRRKAIMGSTATTATPATILGSLLPTAEDLCGTQVMLNAPWTTRTTPPSAPAGAAAAVPAGGGGTHRRR